MFSTTTENGLKNWGKSVSQKAVWENKKLANNEARFVDLVQTFKPFKGDIMKTGNIFKELNKSNVGKNAIEYITKNNIIVDIYYSDEAPKGVRGQTYGTNICIFAKNTKTIKCTAETIIHEVTHIERQIGHSQWAEAVCFCQELKHTKEALTISDLKNIIKNVKKLYPEYKWR